MLATVAPEYIYYLYIFHCRSCLLETAENYGEEEKNEFLAQVKSLSTMQSGKYKQVSLPSVPLKMKVDNLSWTALGHALIETYKDLKKNSMVFP